MFDALRAALRGWYHASLEALHPPHPDRRRHALLTPSLILVAMLVTYLITRLHATYAIERAQKINDQRIDALMTAVAAERARAKTNYDELYRTLYTTMVDAQDAKVTAATTAATRRPSAIELWQANRDKEIAKRLAALEAWRYRWDR